MPKDGAKVTVLMQSAVSLGTGLVSHLFWLNVSLLQREDHEAAFCRLSVTQKRRLATAVPRAAV